MYEQQFWKLARDAIARNLVTEEEVSMICRLGTRKQDYWARHLRDLRALVDRRQEERK